jgi:hypothetical protein
VIAPNLEEWGALPKNLLIGLTFVFFKLIVFAVFQVIDCLYRRIEFDHCASKYGRLTFLKISPKRFD